MFIVQLKSKIRILASLSVKMLNKSNMQWDVKNSLKDLLSSRLIEKVVRYYVDIIMLMDFS